MNDDHAGDKWLLVAPAVLRRLYDRADQKQWESRVDRARHLDCIEMTAALVNYLYDAHGWSESVPVAYDAAGGAIGEFFKLDWLVKQGIVKKLGTTYRDSAPMAGDVRELAWQVLVHRVEIS